MDFTKCHQITFYLLKEGEGYAISDNLPTYKNTSKLNSRTTTEPERIRFYNTMLHLKSLPPQLSYYDAYGIQKLQQIQVRLTSVESSYPTKSRMSEHCFQSPGIHHIRTIHLDIVSLRQRRRHKFKTVVTQSTKKEATSTTVNFVEDNSLRLAAVLSPHVTPPSEAVLICKREPRPTYLPPGPPHWQNNSDQPQITTPPSLPPPYVITSVVIFRKHTVILLKISNPLNDER